MNPYLKELHRLANQREWPSMVDFSAAYSAYQRAFDDRDSENVGFLVLEDYCFVFERGGREEDRYNPTPHF